MVVWAIFDNKTFKSGKSKGKNAILALPKLTLLEALEKNPFGLGT